jgi:hypothetical protein
MKHNENAISISRIVNENLPLPIAEEVLPELISGLAIETARQVNRKKQRTQE